MNTFGKTLLSRRERAIKKADEICARMSRFGIETTNVATSPKLNVDEHLDMPRVKRILEDRGLSVHSKPNRGVVYYTIEA